MSEPTDCDDCGKLIEANKEGVYVCDCGWVGWTAERLSTITNTQKNRDISKYRRNSRKHGRTKGNILNLLKSSSKSLKPKQISKALNIGQANAYTHLKDLMEAGKVGKTLDGCYYIPRQLKINTEIKRPLPPPPRIQKTPKKDPALKVCPICDQRALQSYRSVNQPHRFLCQNCGSILVELILAIKHG